jgi:glucose uptake protein
MILPGSYLASLLLLVLVLFCWGSWANTFLAAGKKWRFELYYFDFAIGVFLAALICALTLGSLGWDGFSFLDDLRLAGKRQDLFALGAGVIFNLGNMLLVAGISLVGMSVAFPVGFGLALITGAIWSAFLGPSGSPLFRLGGAAALIVAIIVNVLAYRTFAKARLVELIQTGKTKSTKKVISLKGVVLSLAGGVFLGSFYQLVQMGRESEIGLGPYSLGFIFATGVVISTFVFNLFFMNLPVAGKPVDMVEFFRAKIKVHISGIFGGIIWYLGALATFVLARSESTASASPTLSFALTQGGIVIATLWGLIYWKELSGTDTKLSYHVGLMLVFLLLGIGLLSAAPAFAAV